MSGSLASWSRPADGPVALVAALLAGVLFLCAWALLHRGFYEREQLVDTGVYQRYGDAIADGAVPYRDVRPEYPPGALPVFVVPSLVAAEGDEGGYRDAFELLMAGCGLLALGAMAVTLRAVRAPPAPLAAALAAAALAPLALGSVVLTRFDLWPAAVTVSALAALVAGRDRLGAGLLGFALAIKLYPAVLVPLAAAWVWRRRGRAGARAAGGVFAAVVAVCIVPFLVLGPAGVWEMLSRQLSRPLQIESLGAGALISAAELGGPAVAVVSSHGSQNLAGRAADVVATASTVVQVAVLVALWTAFARGEMTRQRLIRYAAAAVVAFVAFGKVVSPQFLLWLVPLVPLVRGRRGVASSALLAAALVVTQLWFPYRYWDLANELDANVAALVVLRGLLLAALLAVLVRPERAAS